MQNGALDALVAAHLAENGFYYVFFKKTHIQHVGAFCRILPHFAAFCRILPYFAVFCHNLSHVTEGLAAHDDEVGRKAARRGAPGL